jgi:L-rhamnose isomerase
MIHQAALIKGIEGIELVGSWDITESNVSEMKKLLADEGLGCVSIIPDLFSQKRWGLGSFSAKSAAIRQQALEETRSVCPIAREMKCPLINLWLGEIRALIAKGDATASTRWMRQLLMGTSHAAA